MISEESEQPCNYYYISIIIRDMTSYTVESIPEQLLKAIIVGMKVLISSVLDTKDDLYARERYSKRGNLRISLINNTCNELISLSS